MDTLVTTIYKDTKDALQGLAKALGVAAEHVYEILVRQQVVISITYLVIGLIAFTLLIWGGKLFMKIKWAESGNDLVQKGSGYYTFFTTIFLVIGIIGLGITLFNIGTIITGFVNPEYGAIKAVMDMIGGK